MRFEKVSVTQTNIDEVRESAHSWGQLLIIFKNVSTVNSNSFAGNLDGNIAN